MWADANGASLAMEEAKIDGRKISYPYLLDEKGEPRLESTNDFLVWYCERCDIVTKKSVVEKAESWLKACGDLSRAKFDPNGPALRKDIFTEAMRVRVAIKGHAEAYGASSIASGKEVAARADNLLSYDQMVSIMHRAYAAETPQIPLSFQLQRGLLPWTPEKRALVDAVQFRVLREKRDVVAQLLELAVPKQDAKVAAIADLPEDPSCRAEVNETRRANRDSHKREHLRFLAVIREMMSLAIIGAACRPRNRKGEIMYDALSLIEQHGKERLYKGIRIPVGGTSYGDTWLFDHPLFKQIQEAVKEAEDGERISASAAEQAAVKAQAAAMKEAMAPELAAAMDAGKAAIKLANAIPVAANKLSMCAPCESGNFSRWMQCCIDFGCENMNGWSGSCPCRTVLCC